MCYASLLFIPGLKRHFGHDLRKKFSLHYICTLKHPILRPFFGKNFIPTDLYTEKMSFAHLREKEIKQRLIPSLLV